jgi:molecular chaperone GrpE
MEAEIVELDDLDPTDGTTDANGSDGAHAVEDPAVEDEAGDPVDGQVDDLAEDSDAAAEADSEHGAEHADALGDEEPLDAEVLEADDVAEGGDDGAEMTVEDLVNDLERVSGERDQYLDASRRLQAEFENYKKQVSKREATARDRANDGLIGELLPVLDAFDGAVANGADDVAPMRTTMLDALAKQGLERIDPDESAFDPTLHEAVMHEDGDEPDGPVVAEVLRAGYSWKGRVLRPAMVKTRG